MSQFNWIAKLFRDHRFQIIPNSGGGDCLFHTMSQATGIRINDLKDFVASRVTPEEFRIKKSMYESAKEQFRKSRDISYYHDINDYYWIERVKNIKQYREELKKRGLWADGESVGRLEEIFQCRILLLSQSSPTVVYNTGSCIKNPKFYVMINYINAKHFELILYNGYRCFLKKDLPFVVQRIFHL